MSRQHGLPRFAIALSLSWLLSACSSGPAPKSMATSKTEAPPVTAVASNPPEAREPDGSAAGQPLPVPSPALLDLMRNGQYQVAEQAFRQTARRHPDNALVLANLGLAEARLGNTASAQTHLEEAATLMAQPPAALHNELGRVYRQQGLFERAENSYRQALAIDPDYAPAVLNLGILFEIYRQQPGKALPFYQRFQNLTGHQDEEVALWILDIEQRLPASGAQP